jgi:hypothetical protein
MKLTPSELLIATAEQLKRSAPKSYEEFLGAFHAYAETQFNNLIQASPDALHVAQGRAQNCAQIMDYLQMPSDKVNAILEKANARTSRPD